MTLARAAAAEAIGTALLLAIVVGSGIMADRLAQGNAAVALLANAIATGDGLYTLIVIFSPVSGAQFNPVVAAVSLWEGRLTCARCVVFMLAQFARRFCRSRGCSRDVRFAGLANFGARSAHLR